MWLGVAEAKSFIECEKRLIEISGWHPEKNRAEKHICEARVAIEGVLPRGLWFRSIVYPRLPDSATFQLDCDRPNARNHHVLYRLDWRPQKPHQNGFIGPIEHRGRSFAARETHDHICLDHVVEGEERIRSGDVQCARPVKPEFKKFAEALAFACVKLNLQNCSDIPEPGDQWALF